MALAIISVMAGRSKASSPRPVMTRSGWPGHRREAKLRRLARPWRRC